MTSLYRPILRVIIISGVADRVEARRASGSPQPGRSDVPMTLLDKLEKEYHQGRPPSDAAHSIVLGAATAPKFDPRSQNLCVRRLPFRMRANVLPNMPFDRPVVGCVARKASLDPSVMADCVLKVMAHGTAANAADNDSRCLPPQPRDSKARPILVRVLRAAILVREPERDTSPLPAILTGNLRPR